MSAPRGGMKIDMSGNSQGKKRPRPPKMSLKTPVTPLPTPTPTPTPTPAKELVQLDIEMDKLHIDDKPYELKNEDLVEKGTVGEGHFGIVARMMYPKTNTEMAVKKIPMKELHVSGDEILEVGMIRKANVCPYIVHFYGCLQRDGHVWICMELLDSSMGQVAHDVYSKLSTIIPDEGTGKDDSVCHQGSSFLTKRIENYSSRYIKCIHDVKPTNILVSNKGEFKLCDFGISGKLVDSIAITMDVGCRPYMAPERIDPVRAAQGYTIHSDVWSYGITLLELALGTFPYSKWKSIFEQLNAVVNGPPPQLPDNGQYSQELRDFTAACLIKEPSNRPNYEQLQKLEFFKKYDSVGVVDVGAWYEWYQHARPH